MPNEPSHVANPRSPVQDAAGSIGPCRISRLDPAQEVRERAHHLEQPALPIAIVVPDAQSNQLPHLLPLVTTLEQALAASEPGVLIRIKA